MCFYIDLKNYKQYIYINKIIIFYEYLNSKILLIKGEERLNHEKYYKFTVLF